MQPPRSLVCDFQQDERQLRQTLKATSKKKPTVKTPGRTLLSSGSVLDPGVTLPGHAAIAHSRLYFGSSDEKGRHRWTRVGPFDRRAQAASELAHHSS